MQTCRSPSPLAYQTTNIRSDETPVTWASLPRRGQLAVLTLARLSEPLTQTSLNAYLFYQLRSFNPSFSDAAISSQAGIIQAAFTAAQFITAVLWGRAADSEKIGRKRVLLIGLSGTCFSALAFGFSRTFLQAAVFRTLGGLMNGNVGVMRTMIAEIVREKKYQSRAFLLLPMCFNIGVIIGPILGGVLADPVHTFPGLFGNGSVFGGRNGIAWMKKWPYATPNLFSAVFIMISACGVILGLDETLEARRHKRDWGRQLGKVLVSSIKRLSGRSAHAYSRLGNEDDEALPSSIDLEPQSPSTTTAHRQPNLKPRKRKLPFRLIFPPNVLLTLLVHLLLAFHISAFNSMIFILLPAPRATESNPNSLFHFSGGLGLPSEKVGLATAVIGVIGLPLQLLLYPRLHTRWGTLKCYRLFLPFSPLAYILIPYLVLLPNRAYLLWPALVVVLALQVISRTFALPGAIILINNACPSPTVLGTIHGVAQSVSSAGRTLGPVIGGWGLGLGFKTNTIGAIWWAMAGVAALGWCLSWTVIEGNSGAEEEEKVDQRQ